jgi:hypothetical protein
MLPERRIVFREASTTDADKRGEKAVDMPCMSQQHSGFRWFNGLIESG